MIFLSFCILYLFQSINLSQNQNLEFEHITIDHGLSNSDVHDIIQDSLGFLWIATEDGFNKYDGYKFGHYMVLIPGENRLSGLEHLAVD